MWIAKDPRITDAGVHHLKRLKNLKKLEIYGTRISQAAVKTLRDALPRRGKMDGLALSQAIWARMCAGTREDGSEIAPNDPIWDRLIGAATAAKTDPQAWLNQRDLYGDLADNSTFQSRFHHWLTQIYSEGLEAALRSYVKG